MEVFAKVIGDAGDDFSYHLAVMLVAAPLSQVTQVAAEYVVQRPQQMGLDGLSKKLKRWILTNQSCDRLVQHMLPISFMHAAATSLLSCSLVDCGN